MNDHSKIGNLKTTVALIILIAIISINSIYGQSKFSDEYRSGISALSKNQLTEAEDCFKASILKNNDAGSYFQLGKLQKEKNTYNSRNEALDNLKQAAIRQPSNYTYRLEYALLLEELALNSAVSEYKDILAEFPLKTEALIRLGEIKLKAYNEFKNSKKIGDVRDANLDFNIADAVKEDSTEAEEYYLKALQTDSLNENAFYGLARLYENSGNKQKAIRIFNKIISIDPSNKNAHLFLGMLYHKHGNENNASREFGKALDLMSYAERDDFIYNSVVILISPIYGDAIKNLTKEDIELTIGRFWKATDPLLLSEQNERLLEHYSRMAYSNLYFGVPKSGIEGWKTDRGEVLIRFGMPKIKYKTRPYLDGGEFYSGNDIWIYNDFMLTFDDYGMNGNYKLSWERGQSGRFSSSPRSNLISFESFEKIKKDVIQRYTPDKEKFDVNNEIFCFKNTDKKREGIYDSYLAYELPVRDSLGRIENVFPKFETGIFIFNREFYPLLEKKTNYNKERVRKILADKSNNDKVDNIKFNMPSDTVSFAFEVRKLSDSSFFAYHALLEGPNFKTKSLDISDLVPASALSTNEEIPGAIRRNDIYILPKLKLTFKNNEPMFLYYEVYNLLKDAGGLTDFEQIISIKEHSEEKRGLESFFKDITSFLFGSGSKISLSSSYRTKEEDTQQYMELDFSRLPAGIYDVILQVRDKISGEKIEKKLIIEIARIGNQDK